MKPNVIFLFSDEHGFRFMGHVPVNEGGESVYTPAFDDLASKAAVFTDAYCQMPLCTPSRMCVFTGMEVRKCGAWNNSCVLRPELPTIADTLGENGYETCLVGKYHLSGNNQMGGFKHRPYGDLTGDTGHQIGKIKAGELAREQEANAAMRKADRKGIRSRTAGVGELEVPESLLQENIVCDETITFIREHTYRNPDKPYFLCASFSRPHFPLNAPHRFIDRYKKTGVSRPKVEATGDAYMHPMSIGMRKGFNVDKISDEEMMNARAAYFANVSFLDEIIGDMLVRLDREGLLDNTIIIYSSDHGEMAGEHGVWWKNGWYDGCTRVPFIISLPHHRNGKIAPAKINTPVSLADLFPTLCGLTGSDKPEGIDGIDLSQAILTGESLPEDRPVFCDNLIPRWGEGTEFRMIRMGKYKYIRFRNASPLMFNLSEDPMEQVNIAEANPDSDSEETALARKKLEKIAEETMNFDKAEYEREVRDRDLLMKYSLTPEVKKAGGNLFALSDGRLITADDIILRPNVVAENYKKEFYFAEE